MKTRNKRYVTAEDLFNYKFVNDPQVSPDGNTIVYVLKYIDAKKNLYFMIFLPV